MSSDYIKKNLSLFKLQKGKALIGAAHKVNKIHGELNVHSPANSPDCINQLLDKFIYNKYV